MNFLRNNLRWVIGMSLGAVAGLAYWKYVGCLTGSCPITAQWYTSGAYGLVLGGMLANSFQRKPPKNPDDNPKD